MNSHTEATTASEQATFWNEDGGRRWAAHSDATDARLAPLSDHLLARIGARPGERILDIGCGTGTTSAALSAAVAPGGRVTALDVSRVILDVAIQRHTGTPNLEFLLADAGTHAFAPDGFDVLASRLGVMFFHDPPTAFTNLRRALGPGGRLCFLCWRRLDENPWMGLAARAAFTVLPKPPRPAPGTPGPFAFADTQRVSDILATAGFVDVGFEAVDRPVDLGSLEQAMAWLTSMGPAAGPLREADDANRARAEAAMRDALGAAMTDGRVVLAGAAWVVTAKRPLAG